MEKISLKLSEFYQLEAELNGVTNQQTGEKLSNGLVNEKVKLTTKYWLSDLAKKVAAEKAAVESVKEEREVGGFLLHTKWVTTWKKMVNRMKPR